MTAEYKNWQEEFVDINFTDQRLKSRFFKIIDAFAASPGKSTGQLPAPEVLPKRHTVSLVIVRYPKMNYLTAYPEQL